MPIEAAAAAIRCGLETLDKGTAFLLAAAREFDEARTLIAQATGGTGRDEPAQALGALAAALELLGQAYGNAHGCKNGFTDYLTNIASGTDTAPTTDRRPPLRPPATQPGHDRVEQLRRELPPPLESTGTGRKTHGRWFVGNRPAQPMVSGEDANSRLAAGYLAKLGQPDLSIQTHVEVKLGALVRQRWEQTGQAPNVTVVINHEVCYGPRSCFVWLPRLLPPGSSVTVITPTTRHKFTGEPT